MQIIKIFLYISLFTSVHAASLITKKNIILLYGSSSAGKTTLAHCLQKQLDGEFAMFSYGKFRTDFFAEHFPLLGLTSAEDYSKDCIDLIQSALEKIKLLSADEAKHRKKVLDDCMMDAENAFYHAVATAAQTRGVIVDTMIFTSIQEECIKAHLSNNVFYIFVHIPLMKISERVSMRDGGEYASSTREAGRVLSCYADFYTPTMVDDKTSLETISLEMVSRLAESIEKKGLVTKMTTSFGLHKHCATGIKPKFIHNIVVNTGDATPDELAHLIITRFLFINK